MNAKKLVKRLHLDPLIAVAARKRCFSTTSTKSLEQVAAILNARNQGSARCSAKYADAERGVEAIESDDEVDGDDENGVGDDEASNFEHLMLCYVMLCYAMLCYVNTSLFLIINHDFDVLC